MADGRVLLMKRAEGVVNGGTWAFPAGKIEEGETPEQAALREFTEETGRELAQPRIEIASQAGFRLYAVQGEQFEPIICPEHTEYMWADPAALPDNLHPGIAESLANGAAIVQDSARTEDVNDYTTIRRNPISRAGVFQYMGRDIPNAPEKDKIYNVYRPAEELADADALASFEAIPFIDDHVMLGSAEKGWMPPEKKGVQGTIFNPVFENGVLLADIKIFSQVLKDMIQRGKNNLSLGYRCMYQKVSGVFEGKPYDFIQRRLRGNHLALVNEARSDVAVLDEALAFDSFDITIEQGDKMAEENQASVKDEAETEMTLTDAVAAIKKIMPMMEEMQGAIASMNASSSGTAADADDKDDKDDDKKDGKDASAMDSKTETPAALTEKQLMSAISDRDALASDLSHHVGVFDSKNMTAAEVAAYGVKELGIVVEAGQERAAIKGFLAAKAAPSAAGFGLDNKTATKSSNINNYANNNAKK